MSSLNVPELRVKDRSYSIHVYRFRLAYSSAIAGNVLYSRITRRRDSTK